MVATVLREEIQNAVVLSLRSPYLDRTTLPLQFPSTSGFIPGLFYNLFFFRLLPFFSGREAVR